MNLDISRQSAAGQRCGASRRRGALLLVRRHRALLGAAEDLRALRRQLSLRRRRHAVPRSADVVFGGQLRLRESAPQRSAEAPDRHAAAGREPVSASDQDRARHDHRRGCRGEVGQPRPRAFQRRRLAGGRGFAQARAQRIERQEPRVRVRRRLSRAHARRVGDHVVAIATAAATVISIARSSSSFRTTSAARRACRRRSTANTASRSSSACSKPNTTASGIRKPGSANTRRSTSSRSRAPAAT